jgi:hypothetical protein
MEAMQILPIPKTEALVIYNFPGFSLKVHRWAFYHFKVADVELFLHSSVLIFL